MRDIRELRYMQSLPLSEKIIMTQQRIQGWYDYWDGNVYVSFSGGKDSTVLLHLVRELYPSVEAVFVDTGLEYTQIRNFVKTFDNVTILRPKMRFDEVVQKCGYPLISKEVSRHLEYAKKALEKGVENIDLIKLRGELTDHYGNPSKYNCPKYYPLLNGKFIGSARCCQIMKKEPAKRYGRQSGKKTLCGYDGL